MNGGLRRTLAVAALATALGAALFATACGGDDDDTGATGGASPAATAPRATATPTGDPAAAFRSLDVPLQMADGYALGSASAKVTLVVFEDFQCPHCLNWTLTIEPTIVKDYVATGKVRLEFRNFPILGEESGAAALGAQCAADQNKFWPYQKKLFLVEYDAGQLKNEKTQAGRFSAENLVKYAGDVGLDAAAFTTCLGAPDTGTKVAAHLRNARDLGLRGTPSFLIGDQPVANPPGDAAGWKSFLDDALK